eukprot:1961205-Prymnesium_polylepis.1
MLPPLTRLCPLCSVRARRRRLCAAGARYETMAAQARPTTLAAARRSVSTRSTPTGMGGRARVGRIASRGITANDQPRNQQEGTRVERCRRAGALYKSS